MSTDFFLDRRLQGLLRDKLATVPELVEELAITITRQARIQRMGLGKPRRQRPGSQLPFHIGAAAAADMLHNSLSTWTRLVCDERHIHYNGHNDAASLARWLRRNMIALALTEGSGEAYVDLVERIDECRRQIDLPPDDQIIINRARVHEANRQVLTAGQVERIASRLGPVAEGLNKRRVETLTRSGRLRPCGSDGGVQFFRLGDVLDAHRRHTTRKRKKPA